MKSHADLVIVHADVLTLDAASSRAEAIAVRDGRILAVGDRGEIEHLAGPGTDRMDAGGQTVIPGLIDTHAHVEAAGVLNYTISFEGVRNVSEAQARVAEMAARTSRGEWLRGRIWHPLSQLAERRFLTREELDEVAPDHPVVLPTSHFTMTNSRALALARITAKTDDPPGGTIHRKKGSREPMGVLEESAESIVNAVVPEWSTETQIEQMKEAMAYFNRFGITTAISACVSPKDMRILDTLRRERRSTLRLGIMFAPTGGLNPTLSLDEWEAFLSRMGVASGFGDNWLQFCALKMQVDGGMTLRTALMREPYPGDQDYRGTIVVTEERLRDTILVANRYGWRVGAHAVGDAAIDILLGAYEAADRERSIRDRRFIVIHGSLMQEDQMRRAAAMGVRVDAQSVFLWDKAEAIARNLGRETAARAVPLRTMIDVMGLDNVAQGTDYPINVLDPFVNMHVMVTRQDVNGTVFGPEEAVTVEEALRLYTSAAARYAFVEDQAGTIEPGKLADFAFLSANPLTINPASLRSIRVLRTMVGGQTVFSGGL
jgi:predicted amidohydrolase YtcJ